MSIAHHDDHDLRVQVRSTFSFDDLTLRMSEGGVISKDVEFDPHHFLVEQEGGVREVTCRVLRHLDVVALEEAEGTYAHSTLSELLSFHASHGRVPGLKRLVAARKLWKHPATLSTMIYAPALYFFPDEKNYLGLHRLDELWLPEYGLLMTRTDA